MPTHVPTPKTLVRNWHLIDAKDQVLGRIATQAAIKLMGKHKTDFMRHADMGDHVVIINSQDVVVTGNKATQKKYRRHSGYPGGFRETTLEKLHAEKPTEIVVKAIRGMLPDNKLQNRMLTRLHVFPGPQNPYGQHFK